MEVFFVLFVYSYGIKGCEAIRDVEVNQFDRTTTRVVVDLRREW